jgi:hypothetical protein
MYKKMSNKTIQFRRKFVPKQPIDRNPKERDTKTDTEPKLSAISDPSRKEANPKATPDQPNARTQ